MKRFLNVFALTICSTAIADGHHTLSEYLKVDASGARLSSETAARSLDLVSWFEEPGWDSVTSIESYSVKKLSNESFEVTYLVYGFCPGKLSSEPTPEKVVFKIDPKTGKIFEPRIRPHVSNEVLCEEYGCCKPGGM